MNDLAARIDPVEAEIGRPTTTARRLVEASVSPNLRRANATALRRLDAWLAGELDDVTLAAYLAELHDAGRASSSASGGSAAWGDAGRAADSRQRADGPGARRDRRTAGARGRGQRDRSTWLCSLPAAGRGGAGAGSSPRRSSGGRVDAVIAGLLFMAGMRRSEVSALRWADVVDSTDGDGMLVTVRRSKTPGRGERCGS